MFSEELIDSLPSNPIEGAAQVCSIALARIGGEGSWTAADYETLLEAYALLQEMDDAGLITIRASSFHPKNSTDLGADCVKLMQVLNEVLEDCTVQTSTNRFTAHRARFGARLGQAFNYEFADSDLDRLQVLLGELRKLIRDSPLFDEPHRRRLLLKLESLQAEVHKKMSSLDRLWGVVGEMGVVLGKFGTDVKPIVDRCREVLTITLRTQLKTEGVADESASALEKAINPKLLE